MKIFHQGKLRQALDHAKDGGQALHMHQIVFKDSPACFIRDVSKGRRIAHLFDQDHNRLITTARRLGVRVILVEHKDGIHQHVDLCDKPLLRALEEAGIPWPGKLAKDIKYISGEDYAVSCPKQGLARFDAGRVSGLVVCDLCGFMYHDHPKDLDHPCMTVLCDGSLAKL